MLHSEEEVVARKDPEYKRSVTLEVTLDPGERPYVFMPCTFDPGCEGDFVLSLAVDDVNDDGVPDLDVTPVGPPRDWHSRTVQHRWEGDRAGGSRDHDTWRNNPQFYLAPSARSRCLVFVEVDQARGGGHGYEAIQLTVARGEGLVPISSVGPGTLVAETEPFLDDGLSLELPLAAATREAPYVLVPSTVEPGVEMAFTLSVYSDQPFELAPFDGSTNFPLCATCQSLCPQARAETPAGTRAPPLVHSTGPRPLCTRRSRRRPAPPWISSSSVCPRWRNSSCAWRARATGNGFQSFGYAAVPGPSSSSRRVPSLRAPLRPPQGGGDPTLGPFREGAGPGPGPAPPPDDTAVVPRRRRRGLC